jgi:hypothetical protein
VLGKISAEKESQKQQKKTATGAAKRVAKKAAKKVAKRVVAKKAKGRVPVGNEQLDCSVWPEADYLEGDGGGVNGGDYDDTNNSIFNTNLEHQQQQSENNSINNSITNNSITNTNQLPLLAGTLNQILQQQNKSNSVSWCLSTFTTATDACLSCPGHFIAWYQRGDERNQTRSGFAAETGRYGGAVCTNPECSNLTSPVQMQKSSEQHETVNRRLDGVLDLVSLILLRLPTAFTLSFQPQATNTKRKLDSAWEDKSEVKGLLKEQYEQAKKELKNTQKRERR